MLSFRAAFHSSLLSSSEGSLVLHFLPLGGITCISDFVDISPINLDSSLCFIQPSISQLNFAYKLNKQGDNIQPWCILFPIFWLALHFQEKLKMDLMTAFALIVDIFRGFNTGNRCPTCRYLGFLGGPPWKYYRMTVDIVTYVGHQQCWWSFG